jgi:hypothetical protein
MAIKALPETKMVNYQDYLNLLKSTDLTKLEESRWIFEGTPKFLDGT